MSVSGCREIEKLLFDYLEGNLDNRITASVEQHLSACEACRAELERCRATLAMLAEAKVAPPDDFAASVLAKLAAADAGSGADGEPRRDNREKEAEKKLLTPRRPFRFKYGTVAAAAVLVVVIAVGWRILPAFMQKAGSAAPENSAADNAGTELTYAMDGAGEARKSVGTGADNDSAETGEPGRILMFAAPNLGDTANGEGESGGAGVFGDTAAETEPADRESPKGVIGKSAQSTAMTPEVLISQYAPEFAGKATEVVLFDTPSPIQNRPRASAVVEGEGFAAYLINDSAELVAEAERLAAELDGTLCGEPGGGLVWIEIYG